MRSGDVVGGRFRIEGLAGSGGMGSVWRALDDRTGRRVALKLLRGKDARDLTRFVREVQLIAELQHPAVVAYVADGQLPEGEPYLVMEWLDGECLADRIERGPLTLAETIVAMRRASEGLGALHSRGIVHRDLKPSNLFLERNDPALLKVIDLGIARRTEGRDVTRTGVLLGTPGFIAPEQALGDPNVDARADVFALGCVAFKCLTGQGAFGGEDDLTVLLRVVKESPLRVRDVKPQIPQAIDDLVGWMLRRDPKDRPRDANVAAAVWAHLLLTVGPARPGDDPLDEAEMATSPRQTAVDFPNVWGFSGAQPQADPEATAFTATKPFPLTSARRAFEEAEDTADARSTGPQPLFAQPAAEPARIHAGRRRIDDPVTVEPDEAEPLDETSGIELITEPSHTGASGLGEAVAAALERAEASRATATTSAPHLPPPRPPPHIEPPARRIPTVDEERIRQQLADAEAALRKNDFRAALLLARRGVEAGATGTLRGTLRLRQAEAHRWRGELIDAERAGNEAMAELPPQDPRFWAAAREAVLGAGARNDAARVQVLAEQLVQWAPHAGRAVLAAASGDPSALPGANAARAAEDAAMIVATLAAVATHLVHTGQPGLLAHVATFARQLGHVESVGTPAVRARVAQIEGLLAVQRGDPYGYLTATEVSIASYTAANDARNALVQRVNAAFARAELGDYATAEAQMIDAIAGCERLGLNHVALAGRANLGMLRRRRGRAQEARTQLLEVVKASIAEGDKRLEAATRTYLAWALLDAEEAPGALREAKGAVDLWASPAPGRALSLAVLARAQLAHGRPMAALEAVEEASDLLTAAGGLDEGEALIRLVLAEAREAMGDREGAAVAISIAAARLMARASWIGDPGLAESFLRQVPEHRDTFALAAAWSVSVPDAASAARRAG